MLRPARLLLWLAACCNAGEVNYLLVSHSEIEAAKRTAGSSPWAREALRALVQEAEKAASGPLEIPDRGGQWPHWYSCKRDGSRLRTLSRTEHRCPACGAVYRGEPYDSVVLSQIHDRNARQIRDLGLAYRFTARSEFAKRAGEILVGYADRYRAYPRHNVNGEDRVGGGKLMAQTLDESVWLIPAAWGYSLVRDTLGEAARSHIEQDLLLPAAEVIREHKMGIHNIQCWKNSAVGLAGFVTGNQDLVHEAIDDPARGFRAQIGQGVTADGLWYEGSLGYHAYTMSALWPLAAAARLAGIDLYSDRYRTLYEAPVALALPDGDSPGFNDSAGGNVKNLGGMYELAYARWKTPSFGLVAGEAGRRSLESLLWGREAIPAGPLVPEKSALLKDAGFAVLRAGPAAVAVRFGRHGGGHGHPDKLNIVTFWNGRLFGLDPGSINYGVPLHREWYRTTIAHNTVAVDQQVQAPRDGRFEEWVEKDNATTLAASADEVYPGVALRRRLTLRPGGLSDRFDCAAEGEHTWDWAFHSAGRFTSSLVFEPRPGRLGDANGYQHIEGVGVAQAERDWWARWELPGARVTVRMKGVAGTEVFRGLAPGRDPAVKVPMIVVRRRAARTAFEAEHRLE